MSNRIPGHLTITRRYFESLVIMPHLGIQADLDDLFGNPIHITVLPPDRWPQSPRLQIRADKRLAVLREELIQTNGGILLPRGAR